MSKLYNYILDYILPPRCLSCAEMASSSEDFCANCWKQIDFISNPLCNICGRGLEISILDNMCCAKCLQHQPYYDLSRSLMKFNEHSRRIIHAFKYQDKTIFAKTFSKLLGNLYHDYIREVDLIAPVPMNRFKRLFRMYNPALILALEISKLLQKPIKADILIKSKWTKSQTFLSKIAREKNLANSLIFNKKHQILGQKILLIDDVFTTGTTANKCSKILKDAGANSVYVLTIAMV